MRSQSQSEASKIARSRNYYVFFQATRKKYLINGYLYASYSFVHIKVIYFSASIISLYRKQ